MTEDVDAVMQRACAVIAPSWPLDRFIAVNPFWEMIDEPLPVVSARLTALSGARLLMPRAYFREEWRAGRLRDEDLEAAITESGSSTSVADLVTLMEGAEPVTARRARVMDVVDSQRNLAHEMPWRDFVIHGSSQFCAAYFDDGQAQLRPERDEGLYASWRRQALFDKSPALLMGLGEYGRLVAGLPTTAREMGRLALADLGVPRVEQEPYLTGLLLDLNGWAAWCAYRRWTARLSGGEDDAMFELLAIRLAWELLLLRAGGATLAGMWQKAVAAWPAIDAAARASQANDWLLQRALEIGGLRELRRELPAALRAKAAPEPVVVQAAFCIDVRSEVFRRALEATSANVQTLGFAGFFGMPIAYQEVGCAVAEPRLPGLLAPRLRVTDANVPTELAAERAERLTIDAAWKAFKTSAISSFAFVESMGIFSAGKLVTESFRFGAPDAPAGLTSREDAARKPRLTSLATGGALEVDDRCALAEGILRAMSLTRGFARLVVLLGHGSQTRNNPHAAGLACGACGGRSGDANARAAAALLNEPDVRAGLSTRGIAIPTATRFLAGLHDTTTDRVTLYDLDELPASHRADLDALRGWLDEAAFRARRERAPRLGLEGIDGEALLRALDERGRDWAQVRPEWGLADNAIFVVAPRARTRDLDLAGRAFLHEYRFEEDPDFAVLELIMTAPMIVTHWINLQYYASTVDNLRYGAGNKVLHNVVGGHLGVFEGNGGDLRIGLPMQSLHDGERWIHTPRRLAVFIEAPCAAIDAIIRDHEKVRALVDHEWLYLFQLDAAAGTLRAYRRGAWVTVQPLRP